MVRDLTEAAEAGLVVQGSLSQSTGFLGGAIVVDAGEIVNGRQQRVNGGLDWFGGEENSGVSVCLGGCVGLFQIVIVCVFDVVKLIVYFTVVEQGWICKLAVLQC